MGDTQKLDAVKTILATMADDEITVLRQIVDAEVARRDQATSRHTQVRDDFRTEIAQVALGIVGVPRDQWTVHHIDWARWIVGVDTAKSDGWAFDGPFIERGTVEVPLGQPRLILVKLISGRKRLSNLEYVVLRMDGDGSLHDEDLWTDGLKPGWALRLRDRVAKRLTELARPSVLATP